MRLSFAVPAFAGLLLGWAALAHADAPPAAPIFYCPTPGKPAPVPAATAARPAAHGARLVTASGRRRQGCPNLRVAAEHHRWRGHEQGPRVLASEDVSASQAFIYRYERALHGFDARAADEAWAEGRHPCPPHADHCPSAWRHDGPSMAPGPVLAQREPPAPPPCPSGCPGPEGWRHGDGHLFAERAPTPPVEARIPPPLPEPAPPPPAERRAPPAAHPSVHAYAWQDGHSGYGYVERDQQSERAGGWSYSEQDGQGHYRQWGDRFAGEADGDARAGIPHDDGRYDDGRHGERHWGQAPRYRCPPPVPASSCSAGPDAPVRHSDVAVAGRDAAGYLTWPGKAE